MNNLVVSDLFIEIYKNFNIIPQQKKMLELNRIELLLLLILALDLFNEDNPVVIENYRPFKQELLLILDLQSDKEVTDSDLKYLSRITDEKYVDVSIITDKNGMSLPDPLSDEDAKTEARNINIDNTIK